MDLFGGEGNVLYHNGGVVFEIFLNLRSEKNMFKKRIYCIFAISHALCWDLGIQR